MPQKNPVELKKFEMYATASYSPARLILEYRLRIRPVTDAQKPLGNAAISFHGKSNCPVF